MKLALRLVLGLLFISSALLKLFPIEYFELIIIKYINLPYVSIPFLSRTIIGIELLLGLFFLFNYNPKQLTYLTTFVLLLFFSLILLAQLNAGETENCGCFGELLPMTPLQSLIKNIVMLSMVVYLYLQGQSTTFKKWWMPIPFILFSFIIPYPISPILIGVNENGKKAEQEFVLANFSNSDAQALAKLKNGKYLVPLFSLSCGHCVSVAKQLNAIAPKHPELKTFALLGGKNQFLTPFLNETEYMLPFHKLEDARYFLQLSEGIFPTLLLIEDGQIVKKWHGSDFNYFELDSIIEEAKSIES